MRLDRENAACRGNAARSAFSPKCIVLCNILMRCLSSPLYLPCNARYSAAQNLAQEFHCGANCEHAEHARGKVQRIECVALGIARSKNPTLDVSVLVTGLWGCIESVILKKCAVEYWDNGIGGKTIDVIKNEYARRKH